MTFILSFDTSGPHVTAALFQGTTLRATLHEDMARGQAERLVPLLEEVLKKGQAGWPDLAAIGVGVGPGNFTGIRISVATARGLALSLGIPAVGVNSFEAVKATTPGFCVPAVPAPRGQAYLQRPTDGTPYLAQEDELLEIMQDGALSTPTPQSLAIGIAKVALERHVQPDLPRPAPLYVKPADAAPSSDQPPILLDEA